MEKKHNFLKIDFRPSRIASYNRLAIVAMVTYDAQQVPLSHDINESRGGKIIVKTKTGDRLSIPYTVDLVRG